MKEPQYYKTYDGNPNTDVNERDIIQAQKSIFTKDKDNTKYPNIILGINDEVRRNRERKSLIKAFSKLDKDKTGIINIEESKMVLKSILNVDPEKIDTLFVRAGYEGNGSISYTDLCYALLE